MRKSKLALFLIAMLWGVAIANAQTKLQPGFNLLPPEEDVAMGKESAAQAEQQLPILNDAVVTAYVERIGQRLAAKAGGYPYQYHFKVVNASDINAFALPGGFVYVHRAVLDNAHNEGEVAGVMAHEVSHVALRHGTHQASKAFIAQGGLTILTGIAIGKAGLLRALILRRIGGAGLNAVFLKNSRENEMDADIRGTQILAAAGYSPVDMVNFYRLLEKEDPSKWTNFASDHPAPPDRIARIQKEARLLQVPDKPTQNVEELKSIQARMSALGPARTSSQVREASAPPRSSRGRKAVQPLAVNVPVPSSTVTSYASRNGHYRVSYPSNWKVSESTSGVTIAPPEGLREIDEQPQVIYGAIISHYDPIEKRGAGVTLQSATQDLIGAIESASPHLHVVRKAQALQVSGGPALDARLRGVNPATGINERVTVVTRQLSETDLGYLVFVTPEKDADTYGSVLRTMVSSMQIN
jgi:Zn-dependent protease with chaperone function